MSLRRCPACGNLVERDSIECPICGRGYARAWAARVFRWFLLAVLLGLAVWWVVQRRHSGS